MKQYLDLMQTILSEENTQKVQSRSGGVTSTFGTKMQYNLQDGFPLVTTKKMYWKGIVMELMWFLRGDTNIKYLVDNNVNIWNADAYRHYLSLFPTSPLLIEEFIENIKLGKKPIYKEWINGYIYGELGPVYGKQWRNFNGVDQIQDILTKLINKNNDRRIILNAWNVSDLEKMALAPCHVMCQFNIHENEYLDLQMYQRSADMFLGVPFNIASYSLLLSLFAEIANLKPRNFIHILGDTHIYDAHLNQAQEQVTRQPLQLPTIEFSSRLKQDIQQLQANTLSLDNLIAGLEYSDFKLVNYNYHEPIKADVQVG